MGYEFCQKLLGEDYQYILATHIDHDHIHNHIIVNNTNINTHKTFETEFNQGKKPERAWSKVRELSDEICRNHCLSVIAEPEKNTGVSHYERDMQIEGKSWKEKLRNKLAKIIMKSDSFEDFLRRCDKKNIEVVYAPTHKYKIKYRMEGQERFIRGETLGEFYTADTIMEQIEAIKKINKAKQLIAEMSKPRVTETPEVKPLERTVTPTPQVTEIKPTAPIPETKPTEKKIDVWADIRGMGRVDEMIADLESAGVTSLDMLKSFFWNVKHDDDHTDELASLSKDIKAVDTLITKMKHLAEIEPIYKEYQSKSGWSQSRFKKKNADTIEDYESTKKYIIEHRKPYYVDGKPPNIADLRCKAKSLKSEYSTLAIEHEKFLTKKTAAHKYTKQVRQYLLQKQADKHNEQSRQRTQSQKRNKYTLE